METNKTAGTLAGRSLGEMVISYGKNNIGRKQIKGQVYS